MIGDYKKFMGNEVISCSLDGTSFSCKSKVKGETMGSKPLVVCMTYLKNKYILNSK